MKVVARMHVFPGGTLFTTPEPIRGPTETVDLVRLSDVTVSQAEDAALRVERDAEAEVDQSDRMVKISALIANLTCVRENYGDTCVYIRRGSMSWGAVALNREADDKQHGIFDLHAQHDRDVNQLAERVERSVKDRKSAEARALAAETEAAALKQRVVALEGALADTVFALETTETCLKTWNGGRGGPANVDGILDRARNLGGKP